MLYRLLKTAAELRLILAVCAIALAMTNCSPVQDGVGDGDNRPEDIYLIHVDLGYTSESGESLVSVSFDQRGRQPAVLLTSGSPVVWEIATTEPIDAEFIFIGGDGGGKSSVQINGVIAEDVGILDSVPNADSLDPDAFREVLLEVLPELGFAEPSGYYKSSLAPSNPISLRFLSDNVSNARPVWRSLIEAAKQDSNQQLAEEGYSASSAAAIKKWFDERNGPRWRQLGVVSETDAFEVCADVIHDLNDGSPESGSSENVVLERPTEAEFSRSHELGILKSSDGAASFFFWLNPADCGSSLFVDIKSRSQVDLLFGGSTLQSTYASVPSVEHLEVWIGSNGAMAFYKSGPPPNLGVEVLRTVDANCTLSDSGDWAEITAKIGCIRLAEDVVVSEQLETLLIFPQGFMGSAGSVEVNLGSENSLSLMLLRTQAGRQILSDLGIENYRAVATLETSQKISEISEFSPSISN